MGKNNWLIGIGVAFAGLVVMVGMWMLIVSRDDPPPNDDDLRLVRTTVPRGQNGYGYVRQAVLAFNPDFEREYQRRNSHPPTSTSSAPAKTLHQRFDRLTKDDDWKADDAKDLIAEGKPFFDLFDRAVACRYFQVPDDASIFDDKHMVDLSMFRTAARLQSVKSAYLFKLGNEKAALDEAFKILSYGQQIEGSEGVLLHYLVALAVKDLGLTRVRQIVQRGQLSTESLKPYIQPLGQYVPSDQNWEKTFKSEYRLSCRMMEDLREGKYPVSGKAGMRDMPSLRTVPFLFLPNRTKEILSKIYRPMIKNNSVHYSNRRVVDFDKPQGVWKMFKLLVAGNAIGRMLAQLLQPSLENVIAVKCQEKFSLEATRVLLALKCYQLETGHLPGKLDELVPEYLDKVPVDDFDGKPLRYSKQKKIIYSVGKDLKDSGGGKVGKRTDMDEPTYAIEF